MSENPQTIINNTRAYLVYVDAELSEPLMWTPTDYKPDLPFLGAASRSKTYVGSGFLELDRSSQAGVLVHELCHVMLQHVSHAERLRAHPIIANLAQDVLINESILASNEAKSGAISLPPGCVTMQTIRQACPHYPFKRWEDYDWYTLYKVLLHNLPRSKDGSGIPVDSSYFEDGEGDQSIELPEGFNPDLERQDQEGESPDAPGEQSRALGWQNWAQRQRERHQGKGKGSLMERLLSLAPAAKTVDPYELLAKYFRAWAQNLETDYDDNRPCKEFLIGMVPYVEPSLLPRVGLLDIGVVVDTSGSMGTEEIAKALGYLERIREQLSLEMGIWFLQCDYDVQEERYIPAGVSLLDKFKSGEIQIKGRGGTSFVPALNRLAQLRVPLCVYFTDMYGEFGEPPRHMDVIWFSVWEDSHTAPFGKVINISKH